MQHEAGNMLATVEVIHWVALGVMGVVYALRDKVRDGRAEEVITIARGLTNPNPDKASLSESPGAQPARRVGVVIAGYW